MNIKAFWLGICFAISLVFSTFAGETSHSLTKLDIYPSTQTITQNAALQILVKVTPKDGWHLYWNNPGDTGIPTKVQIYSDFGTATLKQQSSPKYFYLHNLITQYAYDSAAYWLFDFDIDKAQNFQIGDVFSFRVDASWMVCKDECITEKISQDVYIPVDGISHPNLSWEQEIFKAQKNFPQPVIPGYFHRENNKLRVSVPGFKLSSDKLHFIPYIKDLINTHIPLKSVLLDGNLLLEAVLQEDVSLPDNLQALILSANDAQEISLSPSFVAPIISEQYSFAFVLLMAFLGGLILNLMPCIFPILFLKMINLINSAYSRAKISLEALLYFCGVVVSFGIVSLILWIMRKGGEMIGWGFQLQSPIFVAFLFILFFVLGLMFLDILHFNMPVLNKLASFSVKNNKLNAFLTGLFAVLIASPCSAPFMGAAIGYSITQPWPIYFTIFFALAVGYALPFTFIGLFPQQLAKILPHPGKWMVTLKKIFALPIFATCLWLGWVFYNQTFSNISAASSSDIIWQEFSEETVAKLQQNKKPFFIDFTAKWCLTCLVNEKTALSSKTFKKLIKDKNITLLKADWTTQNDDITQALAIYGRNSVPLYIYYSGKDDEPIILPQLLTTDILKEHLN